ncbi:uncharacterized protein CC84DRAFT_1159023 [Paraphaeosphaeria sporulosa]|uniref:PCI domain-containing protein n=1 Tax=Paraphaeosphaeria sporulosa TaxID=1460663 RepID=A0A177CXE2_9PLEO|nr:uncharacterized protein CC84DRAFT_1159023 [Paraphaeosphaeria sporulosa]OAG11497.1 hypothetical protein CC84DRAFT_1159023 [Paraphaeosphaeria sporulosa]
MSRQLVATFCHEVNSAIGNRDALKIRSILVLEPPFANPVYYELIEELRVEYPVDDDGSEDRLEAVISAAVTETRGGDDEEGRPIQDWKSMVRFLAAWLTFIRDVDTSQLLKAYQAMSDVQTKGNLALAHPIKGILVLPTLIGYAQIFARLAIALDKQPELAQVALAHSKSDKNDKDKAESLAEKAANIVRPGFLTCLNDRNTVAGGIKDGRPDGKKIGVYKMANVCLKILFQSNKLDNCSMIFKNIETASPPLHFYPAGDRVTYLYYLGRYHFISNNFYQAQMVLQQAYTDTPIHESFLKQRRLILLYLLVANLILGRFPSERVYARPEAVYFRDIFQPITQAIRKGNLEAFQRMMNLDLSWEYAAKLCRWKVFYQIGNCCEIMVYRSLYRRVFLLAGKQPGPMDRAPPSLDLNAVVIAATFLEKRASAAPTKPQANGWSFSLQAPPTPPVYIDPDFEGMEGVVPYVHQFDIEEIEGLCASLILEGLISGYISPKLKKLAILGAKKAGSPVKAGFPNLWQVLSTKKREQAGTDDVEGWVKTQQMGGGKVVRLASARPAGS